MTDPIDPTTDPIDPDVDESGRRIRPLPAKLFHHTPAVDQECDATGRLVLRAKTNTGRRGVQEAREEAQRIAAERIAAGVNGARATGTATGTVIGPE